MLLLNGTFPPGTNRECPPPPQAIVLGAGLTTMTAFGVNVQPLLAVGSIGTVAVGFAAQSTMQNVVSALQIVRHRTYLGGVVWASFCVFPVCRPCVTRCPHGLHEFSTFPVMGRPLPLPACCHTVGRPCPARFCLLPSAPRHADPATWRCCLRPPRSTPLGPSSSETGCS